MTQQTAGKIQNHVGILRCPVSREQLRLMNPIELEAANTRVADGKLQYLDRTPVEKEMREALISTSGHFAYPVEDDIAVLLQQKAIVFKEFKNQEIRVDNSAAKESIRDFYDQTGWKKTEGDIFSDTQRFDDLRMVAREYTHRCHQRVGKQIQPSGKYFLDAASGPIPHDDYLDYSKSFDFRICVDLSLLALQQAKMKLGERGVYLIADMTNLPLKDSIAGAVISLHTIYHIPEEEQRSAFLEIGRVLKPGGQAVVVYSWGDHSLLMNAALIPLKLLRYFPSSFKTFMKKQASKQLDVEVNESNEAPLYAYYHTYRWFKNQQWNFQYKIKVWRSVNLPFLKYYVHNRLFGQFLLKLVFSLEESFPKVFGRVGQYPMIVISK